jgi:hypothetical protein
VLTAGHCVDGAPLDTLEVDGVTIAAAWIDGADLAVLALTEPITGPTATLGTIDGTAVGMDVTIVGYGDDDDGDRGVRLAGTATVDAVDPGTITLIPGPALPCHGDGGGPVLLGGALVAVASYGDPDCAQTATAVRVDVARPFIDGAVAEAANASTDPVPAPDDCADSGCCGAGGGASGAATIALVAIALSSVARSGRAGARRHRDRRR